MREYDKEFYRNVGGVRTLDYVIRPSIRNNNLGPLPLGASIQIKIFRNQELVVQFQYDVIKAIPEGKQLYAAATFELSDARATDNFNTVGELITCLDTDIEQKVGDEFVFDHVERPRNIRRNNLGPFRKNDDIRVEFIANGNILDSFDYTPTAALPEGRVLSAVGQVDFVEVTGV
jgi:hypothetical protein